MSATRGPRHGSDGTPRPRRLSVGTVLAGFPHLEETRAMTRVRRADRSRLVSEAARAAAWQADQARMQLAGAR